MAVEGREGNIKCPVLLTTGEYDARSPVELVYKFYDNIKGPKELWVYEDTYHWTNLFPGTNENADSHNMGRDWDPARRSPASSTRATRARRSCAPAAVDRMAPKVSTRTRGTGGSKRRRLQDQRPVAGRADTGSPCAADCSASVCEPSRNIQDQLVVAGPRHETEAHWQAIDFGQGKADLWKTPPEERLS